MFTEVTEEIHKVRGHCEGRHTLSPLQKSEDRFHPLSFKTGLEFNSLIIHWAIKKELLHMTIKNKFQRCKSKD